MGDELLEQEQETNTEQKELKQREKELAFREHLWTVTRKVKEDAEIATNNQRKILLTVIGCLTVILTTCIIVNGVVFNSTINNIHMHNKEVIDNIMTTQENLFSNIEVILDGSSIPEKIKFEGDVEQFMTRDINDNRVGNGSIVVTNETGATVESIKEYKGIVEEIKQDGSE